MKIHQHNAGHMTKRAAMPIWVIYCNLDFYMGKYDNDIFLEIIAYCDLEFG